MPLEGAHGSFVNDGVARGLQSVVEQMKEKKRLDLVAYVQAKEGISLEEKRSQEHLDLVSVCEGRTIYHRSCSDANEERLFCKRMGVTYILVSKDGGEPHKIPRNPKETIRTGPERLFDIHDGKVERCEKSSRSYFSRTEKRLERELKAIRKEKEQVQKQFDNAYRFQSRMYDTLCRQGLILNKNNKRRQK